MSGIDAETGRVLTGFDHVQQSLAKIITTPLGARVMREWFGNPGLRLLGENMTQSDILRFFATLWAVIELFEPRFKVRRFLVNTLSENGVADFTMDGDYRPYAHLDWEQAQAFVSLSDGVVRIESAE
jgi:phage baseplate assembly protein W